ncbi:MAG: hypothetical protein Q9171_004365 [Xanthocarpia ochracea]
MEVRADVDMNIPYSIVQKSVLEDLGLQYESCQEPKFTDKKGRTHAPVGHVDLQWQKAGFLLENPETFYVVDSGNPIVELKHRGDQAADNGIRPVALGAQNSEQQESQAQKKAKVEKERAEEKKRQEERDRQKQQGK